MKDDPSDQDGVIIVDAPSPDTPGRAAGAAPALDLDERTKTRGKHARASLAPPHLSQREARRHATTIRRRSSSPRPKPRH